MAVFNKFNCFVENLAEKVHNLQSDTLKVCLTNTLPAATNTVLADIVDLSTANGYTAGGTQAVVSSSTQTSGTYKLVLADVVFTASGAIGPFRYVVLYNSTAAGGPLIGWFDYGSSISLANLETFTVDFDASAGVLTLV